MIKGKNKATSTRVYCPEAERRRDRVRELRDRRKRLLEQAYKIKIEVEEITKELEEQAPDKLDVTEHAIQRFRERIIGLPTRVVKRILDDPGLLEKYRKHGEGTYKLTKYPYIIAAVVNYKVVTCYARSEPEVRLKDLEKYMDFYISELVHQKANGFKYKIKTFPQFRQTLYR